MRKDEFRELLRVWTNDLSCVNEWCDSKIGTQTIFQNSETLYQLIQNMWFDHREEFPNKGVYKMIRRLLIKNIAMFWNRYPMGWRALPAELCKEILHKADQTWISFENNLLPNFREYLIWKASQVGYRKRIGAKQLCYVDENLKVVFNKNQAVGLANLLPKPNSRVEILFFKPLKINDVSRTQAKKIIKEWGQTQYPKYDAYLPTFSTCRLANEFLHDPDSKLKPIVHSCHIDVIRIAKNGKSTNFALDSEAEVDVAGNNTIAKKLYVSIYMTLEEFVKLNPRVSFPNIYITSWQRTEL